MKISLAVPVRRRRWRAALAMATTVALALISVPAFADVIKDDIAASGPTEITLDNEGSAETTIQYYVHPTGSNGCDITTVPSVWTVNVPSGVTADPAAVSFTTCNQNTPVTFTATSVGTKNITLSYSSGPVLGNSDANPGKVTLTVNPATSTPPGDTDADDDGIADGDDNCPAVSNPLQENADGDALGDACDANSYAPAVGANAGNTSGNEGSQQTNSGSFTDADGNSSLSISGSGAGTVTDNGDGTWSWAHTPADEGGGTVTVTASDGEHTNAVDTFDWSASNVNPIVAQPAFGSTTVDCRNSVTLSGISFSDPGVNDDPWTVNIDWGDGSTDTSYSTNTQGGQANQTHTYDTPGGPYTATVTVTDEDGGEGSNTSSNTITVQQTYAVDFLPPFDDSSPSGLIVNKMKNGRVVPVKTTIYDECAQSFVTDPATAVTIATSKTAGTGTGDPVETYADAGQSASSTNLFRWSSDGFWIYNLDSKALGLVVNNSYRVDVFVDTVKATRDSWAVLQPVK